MKRAQREGTSADIYGEAHQHGKRRASRARFNINIDRLSQLFNSNKFMTLIEFDDKVSMNAVMRQKRA